MKWLFLLLFNLVTGEALGASCCVSNTSISNLMIMPADWQQTFTLSQTRVIGDVNEKGKSTFRRSSNKDETQFARLELAYRWNPRHQTGIALKYQNRSREFSGTEASSSGWNDVGLSYAYQPNTMNRIWFFQTLNIPTATSVYDSRSTFSVDAHGTGTYQTSLGVFGIHNVKEWDFIFSSEAHHSFARTFKNGNTTTELKGFWGGSLTFGAGYIPWRSKARYGIALTPRIEEGKEVITNDDNVRSKSSLVWDSSINWTYTLDAENAFGVNYLDQTFFGPARNTMLNRSISILYQKKWL